MNERAGAVPVSLRSSGLTSTLRGRLPESAIFVAKSNVTGTARLH